MQIKDYFAQIYYNKIIYKKWTLAEIEESNSLNGLLKNKSRLYQNHCLKVTQSHFYFIMLDDIIMMWEIFIYQI